MQDGAKLITHRQKIKRGRAGRGKILKKSFNLNLFELSKAPKHLWYDFIVRSLNINSDIFGSL
jgi:hypothetical protein